MKTRCLKHFTSFWHLTATSLTHLWSGITFARAAAREHVATLFLRVKEKIESHSFAEIVNGTHL